MSFEVVNTKPSLGEMLPHSAFLGITQEYQLGSVINPLDTLDIFELALTTHHEKSLRYGLRSMLIKCESLIGSNGWTTEHIIKQVLKPYYMNNPDFYFEDSIVLLTSNFKGYINLIKQGCVTIVEQTSADQSQLIRDLGNPNTPAQICIVVEKGKMGLNVHNFKTYFPFRKTDKKRSSDFNHESIPDSPIQEAGRCGRIYTGIKHSDFVKTWGYDTTEYVKSLKTDEEVSNFIEVNSMDLYHPNTDMWRKAIDVIREEVTPSKSMATAWINRIRNGK